MKNRNLVFALCALVLADSLTAQNVGIGTPTPLNAKLEIVSANSQFVASPGPNQPGVSISSNLGGQPSIGFNLYYANAYRYLSSGYGSAITFQPNGYTTFTNTSAKGAAGNIAFFGNPTLVLDSNGFVGVGTYPAYPLDVNGRVRLRYNGATPGIWFNNSSNNQAAFLGNINDTTFGLWSSGIGWRFYFDHDNARLGINQPSPKVALSFPAAVGKKISLYPGSNGDAGFDVWGNELRVHSDYLGADITFGYDTYNAPFVERMRIKGGGAVCIGTKSAASGYMLNVAGKIIAEELRVQLANAWPDYVFDKDYKLRSLPELNSYINENKHLPNIPAAAEVKASGIAVGAMQEKMVEKIEELSLYVIDLQKQVNELNNRLNSKK
jgi:hypothetical protein